MKSRSTFKKVIKIITILIVICILCALGWFMLFNYSFAKWTDYEYLTTLKTNDTKYDIILEVSHPPFPPDTAVYLKIICKDNSNGRERKYTELKFSVPKKGKWVWITEETPEKCLLVFNSSHGQNTIELVWRDIFGK